MLWLLHCVISCASELTISFIVLKLLYHTMLLSLTIGIAERDNISNFGETSELI